MLIYSTVHGQVMEKNLDRFRPHFQFGWTGSPELANSVAMETLSLPHLLVVNTSRLAAVP
jgi:thioredoxin domain-containing protein 10